MAQTSPSWRSLYKLPVEKRTADLQYRVVRGVKATNRYRAPGSRGEECLFCSQNETLAHLSVQCPRLSALFQWLKSCFQGFGELFSLGLFIFGPKYSAKKKNVHTLLNFLPGSAKLAIWLTWKNQAQNAGSVELVPVLKGLIQARLRVEHSYYRLTNNVLAFCKLWGVGGVFCSVGEEEELIVNF